MARKCSYNHPSYKAISNSLYRFFQKADLGDYPGCRNESGNVPTGTIAKVLIQTLLGKGGGRLFKGDLEREGIIELDSKTFSLWRQWMCTHGWIDRPKRYEDDAHWSDIVPGKRLVKYTNEVKMETEDLVTRNEMERELEKLRHEFREAIKRLEPPITKEMLMAIPQLSVVDDDGSIRPAKQKKQKA
jgi:hypothetical protein